MQLYKDGKKSTLILDASALKKSSCLLRTFYTTHKGYKTNRKVNNDTHFGSSFHSFRAEYRKSGDEFSAMRAAMIMFRSEDVNVKENKKYLTEAFLQRVCSDYATYYTQDTLVPLKDGDKVLIEPETKFAVPFKSYPDIDVLIAGTQDEIAEEHSSSYYNGGNMIMIVDAKSTSYWNTYEYFDSYFFNPQLLLYRWVIKRYAKIKPNSIWEWIDNQPTVGCMIDGIFYGPGAKGEVEKVQFQRSRPIVFKDWQLEEFEVMLDKFCEELVFYVREYLKSGKLPPRFGILTDSCKDQFGKCEFCPACAAIDEEQRESYIELNFIEREYNPLMFGEKRK